MVLGIIEVTKVLTDVPREAGRGCRKLCALGKTAADSPGAYEECLRTSEGGSPQGL